LEKVPKFGKSSKIWKMIRASSNAPTIFTVCWSQKVASLFLKGVPQNKFNRLIENPMPLS